MYGNKRAAYRVICVLEVIKFLSKTAQNPELQNNVVGGNFKHLIRQLTDDILVARSFNACLCPSI
jgi:hypothetical protein